MRPTNVVALSALVPLTLAVGAFAFVNIQQATALDEAREACIEALNDADADRTSLDATIDVAGDLLGTTVPDALVAAATWDARGLDRAVDDVAHATEQIEAHRDNLDASEYIVNRDACRAALSEGS